MQDYRTVLDFWFVELQPEQWWKKDAALDRLIAERFTALHLHARQAELFYWRETAEGALAEVIVLDQFSRNIYRDTSAAFSSDAMALVLAQNAVARELDKSLTPVQCSFLYMPYMHSESAAIHEVALELFQKLGQPGNLEFEIRHKAIIDRFGRYPHRNDILGRESTEEEMQFLTQPGSSF